MVFPKELVSSWCDRRADKYNIKKMFCITEGILAICFVKSGVNIYVYTCNSYEPAVSNPKEINNSGDLFRTFGSSQNERNRIIPFRIAFLGN